MGHLCSSVIPSSRPGCKIANKNRATTHGIKTVGRVRAGPALVFSARAELYPVVLYTAVAIGIEHVNDYTLIRFEIRLERKFRFAFCNR